MDAVLDQAFVAMPLLAPIAMGAVYVELRRSTARLDRILDRLDLWLELQGLPRASKKGGGKGKADQGHPPPLDPLEGSDAPG